jgi:DNA-binding NarL/FixJ family response regulator
MSRDESVRILLVDDEEMSRLGLSAALRAARGITVVGATQIDAELHGPIRARQPHVVLVNTSTTGDWRAAVRAIVRCPSPPCPARVVVVTETEEDAVAAVQDGASGVLLRTISAAELEYAVRHVAIGHGVVSPAATSWILRRLRGMGGSCGAAESGSHAIAMLSSREREILAGLAAGKSNQEIAAHEHVSLATVKSHVSNILAKLGVRDRLQAALLGQSEGVLAPSGGARDGDR